MSFWLREIAGWALLVLSLVMVFLVYVFCQRRMIFEVWPWALVTIIVFRGAIHLLKVAVAARVTQQAQDRLYPVDSAGRFSQRRGPADPSHRVRSVNLGVAQEDRAGR
jgi:hypothetical protein